MKLDRRKFAQMLAVAGAATAAWPQAAFAGVDVEELMKPGPLGEMFVGPEDAPVTIVEYASMTCPHCAAFHTDTLPKLKEKYIDTGKARLVFREFPFDDRALAAFMLARCAGEGKYFPMIDVLFEQQSVWATSDQPAKELFKISRLAGFTEETFNACLTNEEVAKGVHAVKDRAALEFGVRSTPTFFINGEELKGAQSIEKFDEMINNLIN